MKKFINDPNNLTAELLEGYTLAYKDDVKIVSDIAVIDLGPSVNQNKFTFEFVERLNRALDKVER